MGDTVSALMSLRVADKVFLLGYKIPSAKVVQHWVSQTPELFDFNARGYHEVGIRHASKTVYNTDDNLSSRCICIYGFDGIFFAQ